MSEAPLRPFARLLADGAARYGDRVAIVDPVLDVEVGYPDLLVTVERAASRLLDLLGRGDRVAVLARNGLEQAVAALACSRAGLVHVGLPAGDPADRLAEVLQAVAPRLLLVQPGLDDLAGAALALHGAAFALHGAEVAVLGTGPVLLGQERGRGPTGAGSRGARPASALQPMPQDPTVVHSLIATSG